MPSPDGGKSWIYAYDELDRLITATNISKASLSQSFTYAIQGNLLSAAGIETYPAFRRLWPARDVSGREFGAG
ncbi:MAG: hypothetical protein O9308_16370 [Beijerinckiaceae bacterium]|nr:hypothetical protein [Beijerinckiaceae bacterium]